MGTCRILSDWSVDVIAPVMQAPNRSLRSVGWASYGIVPAGVSEQVATRARSTQAPGFNAASPLQVSQGPPFPAGEGREPSGAAATGCRPRGRLRGPAVPHRRRCRLR
eukprot:scaffold4177_cov425-Prasinococcus_capsulatus_cf.AAC.1